MSFLKDNEKPAVEQLAEKMDDLEKKVGFLLVPCVTSILDETVFSNRRGMGGHPLIAWIVTKLREEKLDDEVRQYLVDLLEKVDLGKYQSLRK